MIKMIIRQWEDPEAPVTSSFACPSTSIQIVVISVHFNIISKFYT